MISLHRLRALWSADQHLNQLRWWWRNRPVQHHAYRAIFVMVYDQAHRTTEHRLRHQGRRDHQVSDQRLGHCDFSPKANNVERTVERLPAPLDPIPIFQILVWCCMSGWQPTRRRYGTLGNSWANQPCLPDLDIATAAFVHQSLRFFRTIRRART